VPAVATPTPASLPQRQHEASLLNTAKCAKNQGEILARELKKVPDFQLLTPVTSALSDGVEFMLGTKEGLALDDTYEVGEFDVAGKKTNIGFVKVRKVNDNTGSGEGTPSYAEKVKERRNFVGGELMTEWPMLKLDFGIAAVLEVVFTDLLNRPDSGEKKMGFYPGAEIWAYKDFANIFKLPEFYLGIDADFVLVSSGDSSTGEPSVYLIHAMVGAEKKWFMNSIIFSAKLRAGISYYALEDNPNDNDTVGFGGDVGLALQYYINPHFQPFLKVTGRVFSNPIIDRNGDSGPVELGVMAALGLNMEI
jgi:hypothetical protein